LFALEQLLQPIADESPAGRNLRYDAIYHQIAEARSEEDPSLPMGNWARQPRKADYSAVVTLCEEALAKRSKDLWFAAWLGEARIRLQGLGALPSALDLLLQVQTTFWDSLYPEIEEGDSAMRSAPLQWAMDHYSTLVYDLPSVAESLSYRAYKSARAAQAAAKSDSQQASETLEATLSSTSKAFYVSMDNNLALALESLEKLNQFCDEKYGVDGPAATKFRSAVEDVHNLVTSLLRARREIDPDSVIVAVTEPKPLPEEQLAAPAEVAPELTPIAPEPVEQHPAQQIEEAAPSPDSARRVTMSADKPSPRSGQEALVLIREGTAYLAREDSSNPVPYLLRTAMRWGLQQSDEFSSPLQSPPSELRTTLRQAWLQQDWEGLLHASLDALTQPYAAAWLDIHHYLWRAARERGYNMLARCVLDFTRMMLQDSMGAEALFEDGTPAASAETRQWIESEVVRREPAATEPERPAPPSPLRPQEESPVAPEPDVTAVAEALAARGDLAGSVALLMQNAALSPAQRVSFQRRLQASRLCLASGQRAVASRLLQQLLGESDRYCLESWEGPELVGEVLSLLLESLDGADEPDLDRRALLSRLCQVDPVRALRLAPQLGAQS
jgi:type VI secretion system protein ImpA